MPTYILGYGGKWQERFDDPDAAVRVAETVAETGVVVEVVRRRFGFHSFFTAFPESEREALQAWRRPRPLRTCRTLGPLWTPQCAARLL